MKRVYIYTSVFPYTLMAEAFMSEELRVAKDFNCEIFIVPIGTDKVLRDVPSEVHLDNSLCKRHYIQNIRALIGLFKLNNLKELFFNPKRPLKAKYYIDTVKYLYAANLVYYNLSSKARKYPDSIFYSYWTSYPPIAFAEYKRKHPSTSAKFVCRAHTFASYGTETGIYCPSRDFVFKYIDSVYVISNILLERLKKQYPEYCNKFILSRLGVKDNYCAKEEISNRIEFVSCSSIIPLKRIDLVFLSIKNYALEHPGTAFKWTHIGDGPLMGSIKVLVENNPINNLEVDLRGVMNNKAILEFYRKTKIHTLILLSVREGVPVVLMEAISSGIPILATNVGGISDITNNQTGCMVPRDFNQEDFNQALDYILHNNDSLALSCHDFFFDCFNSEKNYKQFYNSLLS